MKILPYSVPQSLAAIAFAFSMSLAPLVQAQLKLPAQKPAAQPSSQPAPKADANRPAESGRAEDVVQEIANCLLAGAPQGWRTLGVEVKELKNDGKERQFEAVYQVVDSQGKTLELKPCDAREPAMNVYKLNSALEPDKRQWTRATLSFTSEGKFELKYDYTQ